MLSVKEIEDIKSQAFLLKPSSLPNVCKVYPLSVSEIVAMGEMHYKSILGTLLLTEVEIAANIKKKTNIDVPLEEISPLKYLLQSAAQNDSFFLELRDMFATFIKEDILLLPDINAILIGPPSEKRLITSQNFSDFQTILCIQNDRKIKEPPPENESDWDRKMRLNREKVAEAKRKKAAKNDDDGLHLYELLEIATIFEINIDQCSLYTFQRLIRRHQAREKWQQDIQMLCAGADSTKIKTQYWGENLDNN